MVRKDIRRKPAGRKPRATTRRARPLRELAEMIVTDPEVQAKLFEQACAGTLHPRLMLELFHYHAGKPPERVEIPTPDTRRESLVDAMKRLNMDEVNLLGDLASKVLAAEEEELRQAQGPRI